MKKRLFLVISLFVFATNFIGCAGSKTYIDQSGLPVRVEEVKLKSLSSGVTLM